MAYVLRFPSKRFTFISVITLISVNIFTTTHKIQSLHGISSYSSIAKEQPGSEPRNLVNRTEPVLLDVQSSSTPRITEVEPIGTEDGDNDKVCVIHVGPHKTGSSTLQTFFLKQHSDILERDNYVIPHFPQVAQGKEYLTNPKKKFSPKNHIIFASCLQFWHKSTKYCSNEIIRSANMEYFREFVNDARRNGSNIFLSSEGFDRKYVNITELTSYLEPQYKIHVVLYYRRFYDIIHSMYNQISRDGEFGSSQYLTFAQWLTNDTLEIQLQKYSYAVYNRYMEAPGVFNVSVVNMHEDPDNFDTVERFACNHLDQAPHVCDSVKSLTSETKNPSHDLTWKLFRNSIKIYNSIELPDFDERWELIEAKFNEMTDIPKRCLSPEMKNKLLQISLESEIALTPESWHNGEEGLENLKSDFEEKINTKLCSMDNEKILTSPEWQNFLLDLKRDQIAAGF